MNKELFDKIHENLNSSYGLLETFVGDYLGSGVYRDVYVNNLNKKQVIKIAKDGYGAVANMKEFDIWCEVVGFKNGLQWVKDWFCPVVSLSSNGAILIMERTFDKPGKKKPDKIPAFLFDTHKGNFGWLGNRFVCHDYASIPFFRDTVKKKMKKSYF